MPVWQSYFATRDQLQEHRTASPIDHPDRSVTRARLEYPTEDVTLAYLLAIGRVSHYSHSSTWPKGQAILTSDPLTDKAIEVSLRDYTAAVGRGDGVSNCYEAFLNADAPTKDFYLQKCVNGSWTTLAYEAVDIASDEVHLVKLSISGSSLKGYRNDMETPKVSATDTDIASGGWGVRLAPAYATLGLDATLLPPSSELPRPQAILEAGLVGSGGLGDPIRPDLLEEAVETGSGKVDRASITMGLFDPRADEPTAVVFAYGPRENVLRQAEHAARRGLRVLKPPRDYPEAIEQYRILSREHPGWLAGKDSYAYQALGWGELEALQAADFYYGELVEHRTHYSQLRRVPDPELRRCIENWLSRLRRMRILAGERDKHVKKLLEVLRRGW